MTWIRVSDPDIFLFKPFANRNIADLLDIFYVVLLSIPLGIIINLADCIIGQLKIILKI